jgi:flagellar motor switch protein FliM
MLLQQFMGEKFGRDNIWEGHLASELWATRLEVRAVLDEMKQPLRKMLELKVGDTLMLDAAPDGPVMLKCGAVELSQGRVGRMGHSLAVRVERPISQATQQAVMKKMGVKP